MEKEGHGRREERRVMCLGVQEVGVQEVGVQEVGVQEVGLSEQVTAQWPGLASVVRVERMRHIKTGHKPHQCVVLPEQSASR